MPLALAENWWSLVIRGLVALTVGVVALVWPGITLAALVILFGAYALIDGVVSLVGARKASQAHERWGALVLEGVAGIVASLVAIFWPGITVFALVIMIAAWAVVTGAFEIAAAVRLRKRISGEWLLVLSGVVSILFGFVLFAFPLAGALTIAYMVGIYAFVFGGLLMALGFRLRNWSKGTNPSTPAMTAPIQH
jgi:uncharacterized membrane protein HdeD (DUF308 family)